jgi:hypothetical protein
VSFPPEPIFLAKVIIASSRQYACCIIPSSIPKNSHYPNVFLPYAEQDHYQQIKHIRFEVGILSRSMDWAEFKQFPSLALRIWLSAPARGRAIGSDHSRLMPWNSMSSKSLLGWRGSLGLRSFLCLGFFAFSLCYNFACSSLDLVGSVSRRYNVHGGSRV